MKHYEVTRYQPQQQPVWDAFVRVSKNATFLFERGFMDYHADRFEDFSLMVTCENRLVALFPANLVQDTLHSHQGLSYGGLLLPEALRFEHVAQIFKALLVFLEKKGITTVQIKSIPDFYQVSPAREFEWLLFKMQALRSRTDVSAVRSQHATSAYTLGKRQSLKKAQQFHFECREEPVFDTFWNQVLLPNLTQKFDARPVHNLEEITLLAGRFPKNIRQFNLYENGALVGGTTIFETHTTAHCQYISGLMESNRRGALDFLFHHLLTSVFQDKPYFDFGTSNEDAGTHINQGLLYWKESFGAQIWPQHFYEIKTANAALLNDIWS